MTKVLVIGSKGMLGRDLCVRLRQEFEVVEADIEEVDIRDHAATCKLVSSIKPDEVVNVAAFTDVDGAEIRPSLAYEINAEGAGNVAKAASQIGARCTYIGTDFIFATDKGKNAPYVEDDEPRPMGVYSRSKLAGELNVKRYADRFLIIRTAWLFGLHGKNFIDAILKKARESDLRVVDDQVGCPTFSIDLSEAIARLLRTQDTGTFHCCNAGSCSWCEFARAIVGMAGFDKVEVSPISTEELNRPAPRPAYSVLNTDKLLEKTGFRMPPWEDALGRYLRLREERQR